MKKSKLINLKKEVRNEYLINLTEKLNECFVHSEDTLKNSVLSERYTDTLEYIIYNN